MKLKLALLTGLMFTTSNASSLTATFSQPSCQPSEMAFLPNAAVLPPEYDPSALGSEVRLEDLDEDGFVADESSRRFAVPNPALTIEEPADQVLAQSASMTEEEALATAIAASLRINAPAAPMTDDEALTAAIKASKELADQIHAFNVAQAAAAASPKSTIGNVAFEAVMRDANNVKASSDLSKLREAINNVKSVQGTIALTSDQGERVDQMLFDLTCALSVITTQNHLGAR